MPTYKLYNYDDIAKALKAMRDGKGGKWKGPNVLHHDVAATCPPPEWHFSKEGLAYHAEQDRDFLDVYTLVAFQLGFHNGAVQRDQYHKEKNHGPT